MKPIKDDSVAQSFKKGKVSTLANAGEVFRTAISCLPAPNAMPVDSNQLAEQNRENLLYRKHPHRKPSIAVAVYKI